MKIGMIGLGLMGASTASRLPRDGQECVVHDQASEDIERLVAYHANLGQRDYAVVAETMPVHCPAHYQYEIDLPEIADVWRHGSVIVSWLLDLTAAALAAIDGAVSAPLLSKASYVRIGSRAMPISLSASNQPCAMSSVTKSRSPFRTPPAET
jgi:6-phosphogluconate dehydrogenase